MMDARLVTTARRDHTERVAGMILKAWGLPIGPVLDTHFLPTNP